MRYFLTLAALWIGLGLGLGSAVAAETPPIDTGRVEARLVSSHDLVVPGQTIRVGLLTDLDEGWHTYWRNPGDSGEPVQVSWEVPEGTTVGDIYWPVPMPVPTGPIINYGFEGAPLFPVDVTIPGDASGTFTVGADVYYLVCKDICVPESGQLSLDLVVADSAVNDPIWEPRLEDAVQRSPQLSERAAAARLEDGILVVEVAGGGGLREPYLFPLDNTVIDHSAPQIARDAMQGVRFELTPGFGWEEGQSEFGDTFRALLAFDGPIGRQGEYVDIDVGGEVNIGEVAAAAPAADPPVNSAEGTGAFFLVAVLSALAGGAILNLMPCVFPVISLKALAMARTAHAERSEARIEGWLYTGGILATMMGLAGLIIALKAGGATLGWGFQLQDPRVVGVLALLTFLIGLNLLGAFEFGTRLQNAGGGLVAKGGRGGAFWTGVLAVIVATPCTAPLMAGAIGFALAQPAHVTLAVFFALGIGFALPFLLLAYSPWLLRRLPKPGPWMETFRQFLAFPMFATAIWLAWVLSNQAGSFGLLFLLSAALLVAFAVWLARRRPRLLALVAVGFAVVVFGIRGGGGTTAVAEIEEGAWSADAVRELQAEGRAVFVDFTADWCVTCKVNERLVLSRDDVRQAFAETDTAFLVADWTNKNDEIARELERFGRAGVPLYLLYAAPGHEGVSPRVMPQILTPDMVREALLEANG